MKTCAALLVAFAVSATPAWAVERPAPFEPAARPCPVWGPGFVKLPDSEVCVRVKGRVTVEYGASTGRRISRDEIAGFGASGRVEMDTRSQTEYGPLRTVVRVKGGRTSGGE